MSMTDKMCFAGGGSDTADGHDMPGWHILGITSGYVALAEAQ